ncbi:MAG: Imm17 family immunity protein [Oscillospiraceae bacterium]
MLIIIILVGGGIILCGVMNFEWFFKARKARMIESLFGRTGARIFYIILGLVFTVGGIVLCCSGRMI